MPNTTLADVLIIGGGAAGLMCALEAGKRGRKVIVLEHSERVGKKILISGGGRCNFTNLYAGPENYISGNEHFCKSALARFTPDDFVALVEKHRISYHEKKLGQLFCDVSSRQIVELFQKELAETGVEIRVQCDVQAIEKNDLFAIRCNDKTIQSNSLVIATGGLSYSKIGATDLGFRIAKQFGIGMIPPRPGLVPLLLREQDKTSYASLAGIALDVSIETGGKEFRENLLFTHLGLSGPAILQASNYWQSPDPISINLFPDADALAVLSRHGPEIRELNSVLSEYVPRRFVQVWTGLHADSRPMRQYSPRDLERIAGMLRNWQLRPGSTAGYDKAEVTLGGVDTSELSSKTLESRKIPGLYFIGEVVDVTGWLGGYNFQWAWASGHACGQVV